MLAGRLGHDGIPVLHNLPLAEERGVFISEINPICKPSVLSTTAVVALTAAPVILPA
jgi:hypothetical protein